MFLYFYLIVDVLLLLTGFVLFVLLKNNVVSVDLTSAIIIGVVYAIFFVFCLVQTYMEYTK